MSTISPVEQSKSQLVLPRLNAKQTASRLRNANLCLYASKTNGRFICRIADKSGTIVSTATRSTLEGAIIIAFGNTLA